MKPVTQSLRLRQKVLDQCGGVLSGTALFVNAHGINVTAAVKWLDSIATLEVCAHLSSVSHVSLSLCA